jgi:hypothetical protein
LLQKKYHAYSKFDIFILGKDDDEKKKTKENTEKGQITKMDQNQNGISNGQSNKIMIE